MPELYIGITGPPWAGKTTLAKAIGEQYGALVVSMSKYIRAELADLCNPNPSRSDMSAHTYAMRMLAGPEYWMQETLWNINPAHGIAVVIDGLRNPLGDVHYLRQSVEYPLIIGLTVPEEVLIKRVTRRAITEPERGDPTDPQEIARQIRADTFSGGVAGFDTLWCFLQADVQLDGNRPSSQVAAQAFAAIELALLRSK